MHTLQAHKVNMVTTQGLSGALIHFYNVFAHLAARDGTWHAQVLDGTWHAQILASHTAFATKPFTTRIKLSTDGLPIKAVVYMVIDSCTLNAFLQELHTSSRGYIPLTASLLMMCAHQLHTYILISFLQSGVGSQR